MEKKGQRGNGANEEGKGEGEGLQLEWRAIQIPPMPPITRKPTNQSHVRKMKKPPIRSPLPPKVANSTKPKPPGKYPSPQKKDIEKKLNAVHKANEKLRVKSIRLVKELASLKEEENELEQERDRLQQLWMVREDEMKGEGTVEISREETEGEKEKRHQMERVVQRMKTAQEESITQLQQKMRSLLLAAKTQRVVTTQTELVYVGGPFEDREVQTVEELTREKAAVQLRQNDEMLARMVEELERERLNAQSDLKYAIVQLEQRMKEEREGELRKLKEEKLRQLEEVSAIHADELRRVEDEWIGERERARDEETRMNEEIANLEEERDRLRIDLEMKRGEAQRAEEDVSRTRRDKERIQREHNKLLTRSEAVKRDAIQLERMKREVNKYKEINEILMGEYSKMEEERDRLVETLQRGVSRLEVVNKSRTGRLKERLSQIEDSLIGE